MTGDDGGYNPKWWTEAKAQSLQRKKLVRAASAAANPGDAFLIVTEGEVTEPVYFDLLVADLQLSAVRVRVQPGDASDPRHVIRTAEREAKAQVRKHRSGQLANDEPAKFDQVWAVIDTDVAVRSGIWNDVKQLADARKVKLAHSTPCFEFWLLLHLVYTTRADLVDGDSAKRAFKEELGQDYSTNKAIAKEAISSIIPHWPNALEHAERVRTHHEAAQTPEPANPSTEVDKLVRAMNDSAPEHQRKL